MKINKLFNFHRTRLLLFSVFALLLVATSCAILQFQPGQGTEESISTDDQLFHWHREGGIAGFCDDVTIVSMTTASVSSCRARPPAFFADVQLTADEQAALSEWLATYDTDTYEQADPATADAMVIAIQIYGEGSATPNEAAWQQMDRFAQALVSRANSQ